MRRKPRGFSRYGKLTIEYSPDTDEHLRVVTARQRTLVIDTVDRQLAHQPAVETRNRVVIGGKEIQL